MKLTEKERQKIREVLRKENITINNQGEIEKDKMLFSSKIEDIIKLGGYIYYSGSKHQMTISNW